MAEGTPTQIGRYQIQAELGRGGFGRVFRAYDPTVGRPVAIKVLTEGGKDVLRRFRNEATVAGNLHHENIITVYEYGEHEGQPFLVMEFLEGEDLHKIIASHKPLSLLQKCNIMIRVAEGLYHAHQHGVVHRDVKPANIMVLRDGTVKLMDFGIARIIRDTQATRLTRQGFVLGTLLYMAPEQFAGSDIDALCDTFSFGLIFYELLSGKHPFEASDARALMYKISFEDPPPLTTLVPDCPEALDRVITRVLHKDRELRYQSLKEVVFDIEPVLMELRQNEAAQLLVEAQQLYEKGELEPAQTAVLQVLSLDPSNRVARTLREALQKQFQQRTLRPKIDSLLKTGEEQLTARRFADAIQTFDSALRLDRSNAFIQARLDQARAMMETAKKVALLLAEAQRAFDAQDYPAAQKSAAEALNQDRQNPDATVLLAKIDTAIERRAHKARIDEATGRVDALVAKHAFSEALDVLSKLGADAETPDVIRLIQWVNTEKAAYEKSRRLEEQTAIVNQLLRDESFQDAISLLESLQAEFPESRELSHFYLYAQRELAAQKRAQAVQASVAKATGLAGSNDFSAALKAIDDALHQFPGEAALIRVLGKITAAKAEWERRQAVEASQRQATKLRSEERFAEAIQVVKAAARDYGAAAELSELLRDLEKDLQLQKRAQAVQELCAKAQRLLAEQQLDQAMQSVEQSLTQYAGDPKLVEMRARIQEAVRAQEKARALKDLVRKADSLVESKAFGDALELLVRGLTAWPGEEELLRRQTAAQNAKVAWDREQAVSDLGRRAKDFSSKSQFAEASKVVEDGLRQYPGEPSLSRLKEQLKTEWQEHERRESIQKVADEASALFSAGKLDEAIQLLTASLKVYPREATLQLFLERCQEEASNQARAAAVAKLLADTRALAKSEKFDPAIELIQQGLATYPAEAGLTRELELLRSAKAAWQRRLELTEAVRQVGESIAQERLSDATQLLKRATEKFGNDPALRDVRAQLEKSVEQANRRDAIAQSAREGLAMIERGQSDEALKFLTDACSRYAGEAELDSLLVRARQDVETRLRLEAIAKARTKAQILLARNDHEGALQSLTEARRNWPNENSLVLLQQQVESDRAAWERDQAIRKIEETADQTWRAGNFDEALRILEAAVRDYPAATRLAELKKRISDARAKKLRDGAVADANTRATALVSDNKLEEAVRLLDDSCRRYPGESSLDDLLATVRKEIESRKRIAEAIAAATKLLASDRIDDAISALDRSLKSFPGNTEIANLLARAKEEGKKRQRADAIANLVTRCKALADAGNFDAALSHLYENLKVWPDEPVLVDLKQSLLAARGVWQREQSLKQTIAKLEGLERGGQFVEGLESVEKALLEFPNTATLQTLQQQFRVQQQLHDAAAKIDAGRGAEALRLLEQLKASGVKESRLRPLITRAQEQTRQQERIAAIRQLADEAKRKLAAFEFEAALSLLDEGLKRWPKEASLLEIRESTGKAQEQAKRKEAIQENIRQCETLEIENRFSEALQLIERTLSDYPSVRLDNDTAAAALNETFRRLQSKAAEQDRLRQRDLDLEELRRIDREAREAPTPAEALALLERAPKLGEAHPDDSTVCSLVAELLWQSEAITRAQKELASQDFNGAFDTCSKALSKFVGHAALTQLRADAESGLKGSFLKGIKRELDAEGDPEKRVRILEGALSRYPSDRWTGEELRVAKNQLDLIRLIVGKAQAREKDEQWDQALAQWNSLADVYPNYPGLKGNIERVNGKLAGAQAAAVNRWVERIEAEILKGDFGRAGEFLDRANTEFPGTPALRAVAGRLEQTQKEKAGLRDLIARGQAAAEKARYAEALSLFREAFARTSTDPGTRKQIVDALLKYAQVAVSNDWKSADAFILAVRELEPSAVLPDRLMSAIADRKKDDAIKACAAQAEQLRKGGDPLGALAELDRGLQAYPNESGLKKLRKTVANEAREFRDGVNRELRQLREAGLAAAEITAVESALGRVHELVARYQSDAELKTSAGETIAQLTAHAEELRRLQRAAGLAARRKLVASVGVGALVLAGGYFGIRQLGGPATQPIEITTAPPGASITAGSEVCQASPCQLKLKDGTYSLSARLDGYRPTVQELKIDANHRAPVRLVLEPLPLSVQISTNFMSGNVSLDGKSAGALTNGQLALNSISFGKHQIKVASPDGQVRLEFETAQGKLPAVIGKIETNNADPVVVTNMGRDAIVQCNCANDSATLDGKSIGSINSGSIQLHDLAEGNKKLEFGNHQLVVSVRPEPTVSLFVASDRNVGTLVIETNVDNPTVFINNRKYAAAPAQGLIRIPLNVDHYSVKVEKNAFKSAAAQTVEISKGGTAQLKFNLEPLNAALQIRGAYPGTQVTIDHKPVGQVQNDQTLSTDAAVGQHTIELSKPGYISKQLTKNFEPGQTVYLSTADAVLNPDENTVAENVRKEEQAAWDAVNKNDRAALQQFADQHPNGRFTLEARNQITRLDQERQKGEQAKQEQTRQQEDQRVAQVELSAWNAVDQTKKGSLQDYLSHYGTGPHAQNARDLIAGIDRQQEAARRQVDQQAVLKRIGDYEAAFNRKDLIALQSIWTDMPAAVAQTLKGEFRDVRTVKFQLQPVEQPAINGDSATVECSRTTSLPGVAAPVTEKVRVALSRTAGSWVIRSMTAHN